MNELEKTLQKVLEKSIEVAEQSGEFIIEQGSDLLQQFFLWHTVKHSLGMVMWLLLLFALTRIMRIWGKEEPFSESHHEKSTKYLGRYYGEDGIIACVFFSIIGGGFCVSSFFISVYRLVFILVAPKLYLLDYFLT